VWVASPQAIANWSKKIFAVRDAVYAISAALVKQPDLVEQLAQDYQLSPALVSEWLAQTTWCTQATLTASSIAEVIKQVRSLGIIDKHLSQEEVMLREN
jgi:sugar diacid utilization regulator